MSSTSLVFLRALDEGDLERTLRWHNDAELYSSLGDGFRFVSRAAEAEWLRRKSGFLADEVNLAICRTDSGEHIGNIYLRDINWVARRAVLHVFLGSGEQRGNGFGQQAVRLLLRHAFMDLNLNRVGLEVLASNAAAVHVYEKCGFSAEGRLRAFAVKQGVAHDVIAMSILADEFRAAGDA